MALYLDKYKATLYVDPESRYKVALYLDKYKATLYVDPESRYKAALYLDTPLLLWHWLFFRPELC